MCFEAGRATEATYQTSDQLCGCDQHIQELEQHGRAAIRRQRRARRYEKVEYEKVEAADELDRKVTR